MDYGSLSGIVVILVFTAFVLVKKGKGPVDYLLITFNVLLASFIALNAINLTQLSSFTLIAQNTVPFFIFPTYVFMVLITIRGRSFPTRWYLLFVPGIAFFFMTLSRHLLNDYTPADLLVEYNTPPLIDHIFFKGYQLIMLAVLVVLNKEMTIYQRRISNQFSYVDPIEVSWLRNFGRIYFVVIALTMVVFLGSNLNILPIDINMAFTVINTLLIIAVFYMNFHGIKHYTIAQFYNQAGLEKPTGSTDEVGAVQTNEPARATRIAANEGQALYAQIQAVVQEDQLYLEPALRLNELADRLGESTHAISEVLNHVGGQSFFDFINGYRVEHLKSLLVQPEKKQFTILALGLESGFNSKASLNRIFKSVTGLTPLQFQKQA